MRECIYHIKGDKNYYTYKQLVEMFIQQADDFASISDVVFARGDAQNKVYNQIKQVKQESYAIKDYIRNKNFNDGDPGLNNAKSIALSNFVNCPAFKDANGNPLEQFSVEDFIRHKRDLLVQKGMTEVQAIAQAQEEANNWPIIGEDSKNLHILFSRSNFGYNSTVDDFKYTLHSLIAKDKSFEKFLPIENALFEQMKRTFDNMLKGKTTYKLVHNFNIAGKATGIEKTIIGHIDYMLIDDSGVLHLYNIKSSTEDSSDWPKQKKENYKYQLALLKAMLASKGINVKGMTLHNIPIKLNYAQLPNGTIDYSTIASIIPEDHDVEYTIQNGQYVFTKYDNVAYSLFKPKMQNIKISSEAIDRVNHNLKLEFPEHNIKAVGISKTIDQIVSDLSYSGSLKRVDKKDCIYELAINGVTYKITDASPIHKNEQIRNYIIDNYEGLELSSVTDRLRQQIMSSYQLGYTDFSETSGFAISGEYINKALHKYFDKINDEYVWEFIDNDTLLSANILAFRNKNTGQIDFVSLSSYNLDDTIKFNKYSTNDTIGGSFGYITQINRKLLKATYGNLESIRAITLINEIYPELGNSKLGILQVLSPYKGGQGYYYTMQDLNKEYSNFLEVVNSYNSEKIKDNLNPNSFVTPLDVLMQQYDSIINNDTLNENQKSFIKSFDFARFNEGASTAARISQLTSLLQTIEKKSQAIAYRSKNPASLLELLRIGRPELKPLVNLYMLAQDALRYYNEDTPILERAHSTWTRVSTVQTKNPSRNVRMVANIIQSTYNRVNYESTRQFTSIQQYTKQYFDKVGYTAFRNSIIGDQASIFKNMFETDDNGNVMMIFKNPYSRIGDTNYLTEDERWFLKKALFTINKVRAQIFGRDFNYKNENDKDLTKYINNNTNHYFWVPLQKASKASRRQNISGEIDNAKQWWDNFLHNPQAILNEEINNIMTGEEQSQAEQDLKMYSLRNKFLISESDENTRIDFIKSKGENFFETNIANILVDFMVENIKQIEFNKSLTRIKSIMTGIHLLGDLTNHEMREFQKDIEDLVKLNIFNQSIMEPTSQKWIGRLNTLKRAASKYYIGGNIIAGPRDVLNGLLHNYRIAMDRYGIKLSTGSITKAYTEVTSKIFTNALSIDKLSLLNRQFKISYDAAIPEEALKSDRGGFFNADNYLYSQLRRPDYLNRMVVFVAKMVEDGNDQAITVKDGQLLYDWRKDKRFAVLASGDTNNKDYMKQKGLYLSMIKQYNIDHPNNQIELTSDLPMPYTDAEVQAIKNVANSMYGYYDKPLRAKMENMAIGWVFGQFTTWMNAWYTNYSLRPDDYADGQVKWEQAKDSSGNLLFWDKDLNETTENTGCPMLKEVPQMVQGIWYTLRDCWNAYQKEGLKAWTSKNGMFWKDIYTDPIQAANLRKLLQDLLTAMTLSLLYAYVFNPAYKEYKKQMKYHSAMQNAVVEIMYKSGYSAYDDFWGPKTLTDMFGEGFTPPMYKLPTTVISDLGKTLFGDKTFAAFIQGYTPFIKGLKDTRNAMQQ